MVCKEIFPADILRTELEKLRILIIHFEGLVKKSMVTRIMIIIITIIDIATYSVPKLLPSAGPFLKTA